MNVSIKHNKLIIFGIGVLVGTKIS